MKNKPPFVMKEQISGCSKCHHGATYKIVGPQGIYDMDMDKETAEFWVAQLTLAYHDGADAFQQDPHSFWDNQEDTDEEQS